MLIHKFTSENEANQAIELINQGEGIPVSEDSITRTYCDVNQYDYFWYIYADEVTQKYLTEVEELEIISTL